LIDIDTSTDDQGEATFERWTVALCTALGIRVPELSVSVVFKLRPSRDLSIVESPLRPRSFEVARLKNSVELCPPNCGLIFTQYSIKLPEGLGYHTGSRVLILPRNPPEIAVEVGEALGVELDQPYRLRASHNDPNLYVPEHVTPRQLFEQYIDLCNRPTRSLIKVFLGTVDEKTRESLQELLDPIHADRFQGYSANHTAADFMKQYAPRGAPRLEALLSGSPLIKARRYLVASTPKKKRGYVDIIVESREGLCSEYLKRIGSGRITVKIEETHVDYPKEKSTAMIFVAAGIGIGQTFSLLEYRKFNEGPFGPAVLICEFQKEQHVTVIKEMIQEYVDSKLLQTVIWAFSEDDREGYRSWQEAMRKSVAIIWPVWLHDTSRVYLAGRLGETARELRNILVQMTMNEGGLRDEEASAWTNRHTIVIEDYLKNEKQRVG
jgi:cytochrome P450/NADPH-cytochrome P450 reductase